MELSVPELARVVRGLIKFRSDQFYVQPGNGNQMNVSLRDTNSAADIVYPWNVTTETDAGILYFKVNPGYVQGNSPMLDGTPINDPTPPRLALTGIGTEYVWLKLIVSLQTSNNYVYGGSYFASEIDTGATIPTDDLAAGEYYLELAAFVDGVKQSPQPVIVNLNFFVEDTGLGTSTAGCKFFGL